tara:strand:- start:17 stop:214 length:198 start_codon:yes stop_codon:yes gene_type:complete
MSSLNLDRPTSPFTALVLAMKLAVLAETEDQFDRASTELLYWADEVAPEDVSLAKERCMQELELV